MALTTVALIAAAAFASGAALVQLLGPRPRRLRELESGLETANKESESARAALSAARDELTRTQRELERYRGSVADHFRGTSNRLRELAIQYRSVYDHLATGAADLCPDEFIGLEGGLDEIPSQTSATESSEAAGEDANEPTASSDTPPGRAGAESA